MTATGHRREFALDERTSAQGRLEPLHEGQLLRSAMKVALWRNFLFAVRMDRRGAVVRGNCAPHSLRRTAIP